MSFSTIVLDPPWPYGDRINSKTRGAVNHYGLMSLEQLRSLPIAAVTAPNAHCYIWTTNSFLAEAFMLLQIYGFTQKTVRTWVKPQIGMGHYYRNNTEHVVFGVKGRLPAQVRNIPTAFTARREQHSVKPACFYADVMKLSPPAYLEVFARQLRPGWTTLGNALDGVDITHALRSLSPAHQGALTLTDAHDDAVLRSCN